MDKILSNILVENILDVHDGLNMHRSWKS